MQTIFGLIWGSKFAVWDSDTHPFQMKETLKCPIDVFKSVHIWFAQLERYFSAIFYRIMEFWANCWVKIAPKVPFLVQITL